MKKDNLLHTAILRVKEPYRIPKRRKPKDLLFQVDRDRREQKICSRLAIQREG